MIEYYILPELLNVKTDHKILTIKLSDSGLLKSKKSVTADGFFPLYKNNRLER